MRAIQGYRLFRFFVFSSLVLLGSTPVSAAPTGEPVPEVACPSCDDLNPCTVDSCDTTTGFCRHDPVVCDDANPCTADSCDPNSSLGCRFVALPVGTACDDANPCSVGDTCTGDSQRVCTGSSLAPGTSCDDGNACTVSEYCTAEGQCLGTPLSPGSNCDDQNPCTSADRCVENPSGTGNVACEGILRACDDGNPCTQDACDPASGICGTAPQNCDDGNACTQDACNVPAGGCVHTPQVGSCSDGRFCTVGESCSGGNCLGGHARDCNDGIPCTNDFCMENPGGRCSSIPSNSLCPPSTACVVSECVPPVGCVGRPLTGTPCTDGNACTSEQCRNGICTVTGTVNCDDGNPCTTDVCGSSGCSHTPGGSPSIQVTLAPVMLFPPNHRLVGITATVSASDPCGGSVLVALESITSSEPDDAPGTGDGRTVGDVQGAEYGTPDFAFQLRAERAGEGNGRLYRVTYSATSSSGQKATASAVVSVPAGRGRNSRGKGTGSPDGVDPDQPGRGTPDSGRDRP